MAIGVTSYSADGEDLLAASFVGRDPGRVYIDVGCLYPRRQNNTYYFYEREGSGLCIDPNPTIADDYAKERPRDVFLNCGIGSAAGTLTYYMHQNPVFNTFSAEQAATLERQSASSSRRRRIGTVEVPILTLDEAIEQTGFVERHEGRCDLLSIDVEGLEMEVLAGFSATTLRPRLVITEYIRRRRDEVNLETLPVYEAMREKGYWLAAFTGHDLYFLDERQT